MLCIWWCMYTVHVSVLCVVTVPYMCVYLYIFFSRVYGMWHWNISCNHYHMSPWLLSWNRVTDLELHPVFCSLALLPLLWPSVFQTQCMLVSLSKNAVEHYSNRLHILNYPQTTYFRQHIPIEAVNELLHKQHDLSKYTHVEVPDYQRLLALTLDANVCMAHVTGDMCLYDQCGQFLFMANVNICMYMTHIDIRVCILCWYTILTSVCMTKVDICLNDACLYLLNITNFHISITECIHC
jgi:hypothetical protein